MSKTSIDIDYLKVGAIASGGSFSTALTDIGDMEEKTLNLSGSEASSTDFKNHKGDIVERSVKEGDLTLEFNMIDFTPSVVALLTGGTAGTDASSNLTFDSVVDFEPIELSVEFKTLRGIVWQFPRVSISAYPVIKDGSLHVYTVKGKVMKPEDGSSKYNYYYA